MNTIKELRTSDIMKQVNYNSTYSEIFSLQRLELLSIYYPLTDLIVDIKLYYNSIYDFYSLYFKVFNEQHYMHYNVLELSDFSEIIKKNSVLSKAMRLILNRLGDYE